MPFSKPLTILVDATHNNQITPDDTDFYDFFEFCKSKGFSLVKSHQSKLTYEELAAAQIMLIGVPQNAYFLQEEIQLIMDFVRSGGCLLLIHRYGGDLIQKTNMNELSAGFGILFNNDIVKDQVNASMDTIPILSVGSAHPLLKNINKIVLAGSCSLTLSRESRPLVHASSTSWTEVCSHPSYTWTKDLSVEHPAIIGIATYGQGRIIAIGSSDFLTTKEVFGLSSLDNRRLIQNLMGWLAQPVSDSEVKDWMLNQLGTLVEDMSHIKLMINSFQSSLQNLEHRLNDLERNYYASKGVHLPNPNDAH